MGNGGEVSISLVIILNCFFGICKKDICKLLATALEDKKDDELRMHVSTILQQVGNLSPYEHLQG